MEIKHNPLKSENTFQSEVSKPVTGSDVRMAGLASQISAMKPAGSELSTVSVAESRPLSSAKNTLPSLIFPTSLEEKQKACDQFKVGDVIATHVTGNKGVEFVDPLIRLVQTIAKWLGFSDKNAKSTAVHIAVVVGIDKEKGRVIISEAMPSKESGLRTVDLFTHKSCVLDSGVGYEYEIYRPEQQYAMTAVKAAAIAERFAPKASYLLSEEDKAKIKKDGQVESEGKNKTKPLMNKFSFKMALKAMFNRKGLSESAQKRVFKGIFEEAVQGNILIGGKKGRRIFCSAFGSQVFQKAAAGKAWNELIVENPAIKKDLERLIKQVEGQDNANKDKLVSGWAKSMQKQYGKELERKMGVFDYDFMKMAPQDMLAHFKNNGIASEQFKIVPPS